MDSIAIIFQEIKGGGNKNHWKESVGENRILKKPLIIFGVKYESNNIIGPEECL